MLFYSDLCILQWFYHRFMVRNKILHYIWGSFIKFFFSFSVNQTIMQCLIFAHRWTEPAPSWAAWEWPLEPAPCPPWYGTPTVQMITLRLGQFSFWINSRLCVHVCVCVRACVLACVRACVRACAWYPLFETDTTDISSVLETMAREYWLIDRSIDRLIDSWLMHNNSQSAEKLRRQSTGDWGMGRETTE